MSDQRLRDLEREALNGCPEAALQYRVERIRRGIEKMPETSYQVLDLHLPSLRKKIKSYAKRAHKHGLIPLVLHVGPKQWVDRERPDGGYARLLVHHVTLIGDAPTTDDWNYIAALHHTPSGTVIQRAAGVREDDFPQERLIKYRNRDSACEHCNLRRRRNDTYVLEHKENGTVMQVGRTCLREFLSVSPDAALYQFKAERTITEMLTKSYELDDSATPEWGVTFNVFLSQLCKLTRINGYYARSFAGTAWQAANHRGLAGVIAEDERRAVNMLTAAHERLDPANKGLSTADHNLAVIVAEDTVSFRHARVAGTICGWYSRHESEIRRAKMNDPEHRARMIVKVLGEHSPNIVLSGNTVAMAADDLVELVLANGSLDHARDELRRIMGREASMFLGRPGYKGSWDVTIKRMKKFRHANTGKPMTVVNMLDKEQRQVVWFAPRIETAHLRAGERYRVTGTVYRVDKCGWSGVPETIIQDVAIAQPQVS